MRIAKPKKEIKERMLMPEDKRNKRSLFHKERKEREAATPTTEARAIAKYIRISPRKARSVANAIRNQQVSEALKILEFSPKKSSRIFQKVLNSAIANAENNFNLDVDALFVKEAYVNDGPRMKRLWPRGRGRADIQQKRFSHITVVVATNQVVEETEKDLQE